MLDNKSSSVQSKFMIKNILRLLKDHIGSNRVSEDCANELEDLARLIRDKLASDATTRRKMELLKPEIARRIQYPDWMVSSDDDMTTVY